jgi:divalent metal cation (Fe/Co/Zn/Cd) transporter
MALNDIIEIPIGDDSNTNKIGDISSSFSTVTPQTKNTNELLALKKRSHNSSTSSNNEILTVLSVPMKVSRQFSIQGGRILSTDSANYFHFHRLRRVAFWCCVISFLLDIGLGLTAFINCVRSKSFVGFSYSVDTLMDSLCTGFVSWHLMTTSVSDMHRRDRLACCVIGALFIGSFLAIESRAIQSMLLAKAARPDIIVFTYSLIHIIVFTIFSIIKIFISKQIKSTALMADALNSIIGLIMSFPLLFWDRVTFLNKFAHLDDLVQVLMALFLFVTGWKLILDSITTMNAEYARNLREEKLQRMLKEHDEEIDVDFEAVDIDNPHISIAPIAGTRRFSVISNHK